MHYGVKGMKWRRRKSAVSNGADVGNNVTDVYATRQKQISAQRGVSAADALTKGIKKAKKISEKPSSKLRPKTKKSSIVGGLDAGISAGTGLRKKNKTLKEKTLKEKTLKEKTLKEQSPEEYMRDIKKNKSKLRRKG